MLPTPRVTQLTKSSLAVFCAAALDTFFGSVASAFAVAGVFAGALAFGKVVEAAMGVVASSARAERTASVEIARAKPPIVARWWRDLQSLKGSFTGISGLIES